MLPVVVAVVLFGHFISSSSFETGENDMQFILISCGYCVDWRLCASFSKLFFLIDPDLGT